MTASAAGSAADDDDNYTDYITSRCSSLDIDGDNSATLPRSNRKKQPPPHQQPSAAADSNDNAFNSGGGGSGGAVVELSSLFRPENNESKSLLLNLNNNGADYGNYESDDDDDDGMPRRHERGRQREEGEEGQTDISSSSKTTNNNQQEIKSPSRNINKHEATSSSLNNNSKPAAATAKKNKGGVWGNFIRPYNGVRLKNSMSSTLGTMMLPTSNNPPVVVVGEQQLTSLSTLGVIREEGSDEEDDDPIMEVMDYLEDEIDEHTYDELIPLQIRMALEDQVFGWDHFLSNILGHVGFTVGSYLLCFWVVTFVVLRELPWGNYRHGLAGDDGTALAGATAIAHSNNPWGLPHTLFSILRTALSLTSAISTFRTIRRRRRVWLRQPYGDSSYSIVPGSREARRQQSSLEEADLRARRFVLGKKIWGRINRSYTRRRNGYLARGVNRKLLKAQKLFERRRRNRVRLIRSTSASSLIDVNGHGAPLSGSQTKKKRAVASALTRHGHESSHHERVRMLAATPGGSIGGISDSVRKRLDSDNLSVDTAGSSVLAEEQNAGADYHSFVMPSQGSQYAMDSRTLPNFAMESVSHDQMPFAHGEIKNVPYVHGGFFGAAPFMLTNPHWIAILRILMPDVYVEISRRASYAPAPRLIHWAENNPVVAAYGTAHEIEFSGRVPTLEWDVFLDPYLVRRVEIVLSEKEAFLQRQKDARSKKKSHAVSKSKQKMKHNNNADTNGTTVVEIEGTKKEDEDGKEVNDKNCPSSQSQSNNNAPPPPINAADERLVLLYYDKEIKRRTTILVERMLIAHGNIVQLVMEQTGYLKKYNFSRVKRTRKTLGGGIFARQWLAVYSEAMKLGMGYEEVGDYGEDDDDVDINMGDEVSDSGTDGSLDEHFDFYKHAEVKDDNDGDHHRHHRDAAVTPSAAHSRRDIIGPDSKSVTAHSLDAGGVFRTPSRHERGGREGGPPRKIVMMRSNGESDDGISFDDGDGFNSEPSPQKSKSDLHTTTPRMSASSRRKRRGRRTPTPPTLQRVVDATSLHKASVCPDKSISESISILKPIMQCSAPFGLVLDMKSRHVSRRVWALVIDFLRDSGARVEGIASFIVEEVRDISQYCSSSVNEIVFIHSAGDLQHGCHTGQIRRGDRVFFNAGSLLWDYPNLYDVDVVKNILWHRFQPCFDEQGIKEGYHLKTYAKITKETSSRAGLSPKSQMFSESESETCDESTLDDGDSTTSDLFTRLMIADTKKKSLSEMDFVYEEAPEGGVCSTIQHYKEYYQLSIGLYVQEFAIDEVAISLIVKYVNSNLHVYDLGLSWGGINGLTVKGIQPGRFTATDGLWNQRYGGMPWKKELKPGFVTSRE